MEEEGNNDSGCVAAVVPVLMKEERRQIRENSLVHMYVHRVEKES